jgi:hypothetical protein
MGRPKPPKGIGAEGVQAAWLNSGARQVAQGVDALFAKGQCKPSMPRRPCSFMRRSQSRQ